MSDETTYLETACHRCLIQVSSWGTRDSRSVYVTVFSEHLPLERWLWRGRNGRLRTAWRVLKRGWLDPELEFDRPEELHRFLDALTKAYSVAFGGSVGVLYQPDNRAAQSKGEK